MSKLAQGSNKSIPKVLHDKLLGSELLETLYMNISNKYSVINIDCNNHWLLSFPLDADEWVDLERLKALSMQMLI